MCHRDRKRSTHVGQDMCCHGNTRVCSLAVCVLCVIAADILFRFCSGLEGDLPSEMVPCGEGLLRGVVDLIKLDSDGIRIQVLETLTVLISVSFGDPGSIGLP